MDEWISSLQKKALYSLLLLIVVLIASCTSDAVPEPETIYSVSVDGSGLTELFPAGEDVRYWGPAWSPDGMLVAFTLIDPTNPSRGQLVVASMDGSEPIVLTDNDRSNYLPAWSPDSNTITFVSQQDDDAGTPDIYRIDVEGSNEARLTQNDAWEYGTSWSPDGTQIVFGSERGGAWQIYTMNPDGSEQKPLPVSAHGNAPTWSPDGALIAFTSDRDGDDDIWIMNPDGSGQRNLTNNLTESEAWDDNPQWSPDGRLIAFNSLLEGKGTIMVLNLDENTVYSLHDRDQFNAAISSWSPDGSQLIFAGYDLTGE